MNETDFTRHYMKNVERQIPTSWYKIPDPQFGMKTGTRYVDVVLCLNGIHVGMEWKLIKNNNALPIKRVRRSQRKVLQKIIDANGVSYVMIAQYLNRSNKCVYQIPYKVWLERACVIRRTGKKSIRIQEVFGDCKTEMEYIGGLKAWPIYEILRQVNEALTRGLISFQWGIYD
jgi:penicillin-binding protein-related factor A (putative recombinase)